MVGDYTFVLKITDSAGQTSKSKVTVIVRPEKNEAPKAVAGSDKVVTILLFEKKQDLKNQSNLFVRMKNYTFGRALVYQICDRGLEPYVSHFSSLQINLISLICKKPLIRMRLWNCLASKRLFLTA